MPHLVADLVSDPRFTAALDDADGVGEASGGNRLVVRVGLWTERGHVVRARYRASTCAALIAYAEVACAFVEAGAPPGELTSGSLRARLAGVHPVHHDRAELVASAFRAAAESRRRSST